MPNEAFINKILIGLAKRLNVRWRKLCIYYPQSADSVERLASTPKES